MADDSGNASGLTDEDSALLEFERASWGATPNKESAVRERFGLSLARYYQRLYALCEKSDAVEYDAVFVRQCLEARGARSTARSLAPGNERVHDG